MSDAQERTERPTPRRLAKARAEGKWPSSAIVGGWMALALGAIPVVAAWHAAASWVSLWRISASAAATIGVARAPDFLHLLSSWFFWPEGRAVVAAAAMATFVAATGAAAASGALTLAPAALRPRFDRLSWSAGTRQLVSAEGMTQGLLAATCAAATLWCLWPVVGAMQRIAAAELPLANTAVAFATAVRDAWWQIVLILAVPACIDIWRTRWRGVLALRMTPREVKDERVEAEGRPELRARRRALAANDARNVRVGAIRRATAVVTNPTHVAVALRYAPPLIDVPIVVSRGADLAAALVRAVAALHDVPIIESPELARMLYASAALGEPIPEECYAAVAAVFAWLLQTRGALSGSHDP